MRGGGETGGHSDVVNEETGDPRGVVPAFHQPREQGLMKDMNIMCAAQPVKMWVKWPWWSTQLFRRTGKYSLCLVNACVAWARQRMGNAVHCLHVVGETHVVEAANHHLRVDKMNEAFGQDILDDQEYLPDGLSGCDIAHAELVGEEAVTDRVASFMMVMAPHYFGVRDGYMQTSCHTMRWWCGGESSV